MSCFSQLKLAQTKYSCTICFERCSYPVSCKQCHNILCYKHIGKINNKCPVCRLKPFQFQKETFLQKLIDLQISKQREELITKSVFKCLVEGCQFQGKYHRMDIHRRKQHKNQKLYDIIFPEQREKKRKREALQRIFCKLSEQRLKETQLKNQALKLYIESGKVFSVQKIQKLLCHLQKCRNQKCKKVKANPTICYVADDNGEISNCLQAQKLILFAQEVVLL